MIKKHPRIAYQGVSGAYSEQACLQFRADSKPIGYPWFDAAFEATLKGECDYACLPIENSLAGSINQTYDLLTDSELHVIGEQIVRVNHNLIVKPGVKFEDIKTVSSHPQALAQCMNFINQHKLKTVTVFDTAGAAQELADSDDKSRAVIASEQAAKQYNLEIIKTDIEDMDFNYTRFFILGHEEIKKRPGKQKTSLIIAVRHKPGSLVNCLEEFPKNNIDMVKIESRPRRDRPWSYIFYIDIIGHIEDENVQNALTAIMRKAAFVKFLGSYPAADLNGNGASNH